MADSDSSQGSPSQTVNPRLASVTTSGTVPEHALPYVAQTLVAGADDSLWISSGFRFFSGPGEYPAWPVITQLSATGAVVAEHRVPDRGDGYSWDTPSSMTFGPDGNLDVLGYYADGSGPFGARFVPVDPQRVLDTREGIGGVDPVPVGPAGSLRFDLTNPGMLPTTGVSGVVMNVTVTEPTGNGFLTVHADGVTRPLASNLNSVPGQTVANLVTVRVSPEGAVRFFNAVGTTHVIADVVGFYTDEVTTNAGRFIPLTPSRLLDTRLLPWRVGPGGGVVVEVAGNGGAPAADIGAAVLNLTATGPTAAGYLTADAHGCGVPDTSSLNFAAGQTVPNLVVSPVSWSGDGCSGYDGLVEVYNAVGYTDVIADLFGYFTDDAYVDTPG